MGKRKKEKSPRMAWMSNEDLIEPIRKHHGKSRTLIIFNICFLVVALVCFGVLLWLRIDWGFREWIHQMAFYNFWNGTYVMITVSIILVMNSILGFWSVAKHSVKGIVVGRHGSLTLYSILLADILRQKTC